MILSLFQEDDLNETLKSLYNHPVPKANTPVNLSVVCTLYLVFGDNPGGICQVTLFPGKFQLALFSANVDL